MSATVLSRPHQSILELDSISMPLRISLAWNFYLAIKSISLVLPFMQIA